MGLLKLKLTRSQIRRASSDQFLPDISEIPRDPQEAYEKARKLILDAGWKFKRRTDKTAHGRKFTMTLRKVIWLSGNWDEYSIATKAMILWHELIHVRQRQAWGHSKFLGRYATARGRWEIEVPAYRMSIRVYEHFSRGRFNATRYVAEKMKSMRKNYWMGSINYSQYKRETERIWLKERY